MEAMNMKGQNAWEAFLKTGQVADYLRYAAQSQKNVVSSQQQGEQTDADDNPRADRPREKF
jgi:hypothetical protein